MTFLPAIGWTLLLLWFLEVLFFLLSYRPRRTT